jgi:four helix bundle protein
MGDFKKLLVWQRAHDLVLAVHSTADGIRGRDYAALRSQMVRAAASIDANIVEGSGQRSDKEFMRFLNIAINSSNELEAHLILARDLKVIRDNRFHELLDRIVSVRKMLHGLLNRINGTPRKSDSRLSSYPAAD